MTTIDKKSHSFFFMSTGVYSIQYLVTSDLSHNTEDLNSPVVGLYANLQPFCQPIRKHYRKYLIFITTSHNFASFSHEIIVNAHSLEIDKCKGS